MNLQTNNYYVDTTFPPLLLKRNGSGYVYQHLHPHLFFVVFTDHAWLAHMVEVFQRPEGAAGKVAEREKDFLFTTKERT